ncbi:hypothetical protein F5Y08DRAFT_107354 [Xylaria arbuscula]|nr:hypothetical protein F5Y08DRAFT_107354 [Xylaria arbuscula]
MPCKQFVACLPILIDTSVCSVIETTEAQYPNVESDRYHLRSRSLGTEAARRQNLWGQYGGNTGDNVTPEFVPSNGGGMIENLTHEGGLRSRLFTYSRVLLQYNLQAKLYDSSNSLHCCMPNHKPELYSQITTAQVAP